MIPLKARQRVEVLIAGQWQLGDAVERGAIGFRVQLVGEPAGLTVYYYADEGKTWRRVSGEVA